MFMIDTPVLETLMFLKKHGNAYITGGYLRDKLLAHYTDVQIKPKDIDITTDIPFQTLKALIPKLHVTEQGEKLKIGRFQRRGMSYEIKSISIPIEEDIKQKDFTINSFYYDGEKIMDLYNGLDAIKSKEIIPLQDFLTHCKEHPQAYLRAIRLASKMNGTIAPSLFDIMKANQAIFFQNNENRIRQEGYEILHSSYPQVGITILKDLHLINNSLFLSKEALQFDVQDTPFLLGFLSVYSNTKLIDELQELFRIKPLHIEKMHEILKLDSLPLQELSPKQLTKVIKWTRYKYQLEPEKLEAFFIKIRTHLQKE